MVSVYLLIFNFLPNSLQNVRGYVPFYRLAIDDKKPDFLI